MATVTPYNDLNGTVTTGGTWTLVSGPGPAAPGAWNGTMNFMGTTDGVSVYSYEVTASTCSHTSYLTYNSITPDTRVNDACAGSITVSNSNTALYNDERCPGMAAPTDSGVALPTAWAGLQPDIWYKYLVPTSTTDVDLEIIIDGSPYSDGIYQPMVAVYSGTCGGLTEEDSVVGGASSATVNATVLSAATPEILYIRIASTTGNAGQFDLTINEL